MNRNDEFQISGKMTIGCNYWASHAGIAMWRDWKPEVVEKDMVMLSRSGIKVLRVFPLWPDFQPITLLRQGGGMPAEYRFGEIPLPDNEQGRAGMCSTAVEHFRELCILAEKHGLKLIVSLLTGWMSGRLFVPPALEGVNVLTDPLALQWEIRFVRYFVSTFKEYPAICAWEPGNECNCMASVSSPEAAWVWTAAITDAVRAVDSSRPVFSGMHSLPANGKWGIQDQAESADVLTTHPYPLFTPYCDLDPVNTLRPCLHAVAESQFYRGIGGKPCFAEETGTLGPMIASEDITADYLRTVLFTLWAHDCRGMLWWCAYDQDRLSVAPYDWTAIERELGLFRSDGSPKPAVKELEKFGDFVENFQFDRLPERIVDAICIVTAGQDTWGAAYGAFILAKQAKLDIEYQYSTQPIKDAKLYILPSIAGSRAMSRRRMAELLEKIRNGATLYISSDGGILSSFREITGLEVDTREKPERPDRVTISYSDNNTEIEFVTAHRYNLKAAGAEILSVTQEGMPAFSSNTYGKGKVYYLNYPLETYLIDKPGVFHNGEAKPYWKIYQYLKNSVVSSKMITCDAPYVGITEHIVNSNERIAVIINYSPFQSEFDIDIKDDWHFYKCLYGNLTAFTGATGKIRLNVPKNDALVIVFKRQL